GRHAAPRLRKRLGRRPGWTPEMRATGGPAGREATRATARTTPTAATAMASSSTSRDLMMPYLLGKMTQITTARLASHANSLPGAHRGRQKPRLATRAA